MRLLFCLLLTIPLLTIPQSAEAKIDRDFCIIKCECTGDAICGGGKIYDNKDIKSLSFYIPSKSTQEQRDKRGKAYCRSRGRSKCKTSTSKGDCSIKFLKVECKKVEDKIPEMNCKKGGHLGKYDPKKLTVKVHPGGQAVINIELSDPLNTALKEMKKENPGTIRRNTAELFISGTIKLLIIEAMNVPKDQRRRLRKRGLKPKVHTVRKNPVSQRASHEYIHYTRTSMGTVVGENAVVSTCRNSRKGISLEAWKDTLCHEVNHIKNRDVYDNVPKKGLPEAMFYAEFRAFWLCSPDTKTIAKDRASKIWPRIHNKYGLIAKEYDTNSAFKAKVDAYRAASTQEGFRPCLRHPAAPKADCNLDNRR
jgi:hypothetical protein